MASPRPVLIEKMPAAVQRAWAATNKCALVGDCDAAPTHKVWFRRKSNSFVLGCGQHAQELSKRAEVPIEEKDFTSG